MPSRLSRRTLSAHIAERLLAGDEAVIDQVAALLVSERREREAERLARDIEYQLAERGELVLRVETARTLTEEAEQQIRQRFPDKTVHIQNVVRPELIGGMRILTPSELLDATIATRLTKLTKTKG